MSDDRDRYDLSASILWGLRNGLTKAVEDLVRFEVTDSYHKTNKRCPLDDVLAHIDEVLEAAGLRSGSAPLRGECFPLLAPEAVGESDATQRLSAADPSEERIAAIEDRLSILETRV